MPKFLVHKRTLTSQYPKIYLEQINPQATFLATWSYSDTVFNIKSKGWLDFQSFPPVVLFLFGVSVNSLINNCCWIIVIESPVSLEDSAKNHFNSCKYRTVKWCFCWRLLELSQMSFAGRHRQELYMDKRPR